MAFYCEKLIFFSLLVVFRSGYYYYYDYVCELASPSSTRVEHANKCARNKGEREREEEEEGKGDKRSTDKSIWITLKSI